MKALRMTAVLTDSLLRQDCVSHRCLYDEILDREFYIQGLVMKARLYVLKNRNRIIAGPEKQDRLKIKKELAYGYRTGSLLSYFSL